MAGDLFGIEHLKIALGHVLEVSLDLVGEVLRQSS